MSVEKRHRPRPRPVGDGMWGFVNTFRPRWDGVPDGCDVSTHILSLTGQYRRIPALKGLNH
jgi:hypothetical protein